MLKTMKTLFLTLLLLALHTGVFSQCADTANIYTFTYNGKIYEVVRQMMTWADAASCAVERGGYLAEIGDEAEQAAVYDAIINGAVVSPTYTTVSNGGGIAYIWIGATDQQTEGTWLWDGTNTNTGTHFWTGQGANGAGNGVAVAGAYHNWGGKSTGVVKEPDNFGSIQHYAAIGLAGWPSGTTMLGIAGEWNDIMGTSLIYFVIEKDSTTGIRPSEKNGALQFYPNPSDGSVYFSKDCDTIEVFDLRGKQMSQFFRTREIHLENLGKGVFFIRIVAGDESMTRKIILE